MATKSMQDFGFESASSTSSPRLIMALAGLDGQGKTHFSLTAPGDIGFINLDKGLEGVIESFVAQKKIYVCNLMMPDSTGRDEAEIMNQAGEQWDKFVGAYYGALDTKSIRTVVVDTSSALRELHLMKRFGRATQIMAYMYRETNSVFSKLIMDVYKTDKNAIFLQRMRPVYINDKRTSDYEPVGYTGMAYDVQIDARIYRYSEEDGGERAIFLKKCRQNDSLVGQEFAGHLCSFSSIASLVLPEVDPENWEQAT